MACAHPDSKETNCKARGVWLRCSEWISKKVAPDVMGNSQKKAAPGATTTDGKQAASEQTQQEDQKDSNLPWKEIRTLAARSHFSTADVVKLFAEFKRLAEASPNPNAIQRTQFKDALEAAGINMASDVILSKMFDTFDQEQNEEIDFREYGATCSSVAWFGSTYARGKHGQFLDYQRPHEAHQERSFS